MFEFFMLDFDSVVPVSVFLTSKNYLQYPCVCEKNPKSSPAYLL